MDEASPATDYTHIAFNVCSSSFNKAAKRIVEADVKIWKNNKSEGNSLYFLDPDGHKLELHDGDLVSRLQAVDQEPYAGWVRLDTTES